MQLHHRGVLTATHARRHALDNQAAGLKRGRRLAPTSTLHGVLKEDHHLAGGLVGRNQGVDPLTGEEGRPRTPEKQKVS